LTGASPVYVAGAALADDGASMANEIASATNAATNPPQWRRRRHGAISVGRARTFVFRYVGSRSLPEIVKKGLEAPRLVVSARPHIVVPAKPDVVIPAKPRFVVPAKAGT
jgi:hypothetical protein